MFCFLFHFFAFVAFRFFPFCLLFSFFNLSFCFQIVFQRTAALGANGVWHSLLDAALDGRQRACRCMYVYIYMYVLMSRACVRLSCMEKSAGGVVIGESRRTH